MKFIVQLLSILVTAFLLELFLPWWSIAIAAFVMGYAVKSNANFLAGFLGIALLWLVVAWLTERDAAALLSSRVSQLLMINSSTGLLFVTAAIGGLVGGFAALSGSLLKRKKRSSYYY